MSLTPLTISPIASRIMNDLSNAMGVTPTDVMEVALMNLHTLRIAQVIGSLNDESTPEQGAHRILSLLALPLPMVDAIEQALVEVPVARSEGAQAPAPRPRARVGSMHPSGLVSRPEPITTQRLESSEEEAIVLNYARRMTVPFVSKGLSNLITQSGEAEIDAKAIGYILSRHEWPTKEVEGPGKVPHRTWLPITKG